MAKDVMKLRISKGGFIQNYLDGLYQKFRVRSPGEEVSRERKSHKPRDDDSYQKLKDARNECSLRAPRDKALLTAWYELLAPEPGENTFQLF